MDYTTRLPNELMEMIFERLGLRTLVDIRRVCKRLRTLVDSFRYRGDLAIAPPTLKRWFFTGETIDPDVFVHYFLVDSLTDGSVPFDLTRLRRLVIYGLDQLEQLNECTPNLVYLEIGSTSFPTEGIQLDLPKLAVLRLDLLFNSALSKTGSCLSINSPKLKTLSISFGPKMIRISNPETLEYLKFAETTDKQDLSKYKNLKTLYFWSAESIDRNILRQLPRLQKLVFGEASKAFLYRPDLWTVGDLVDHLMDEKRRLNRTDFNLIFADSLIADDKRFSDYDFSKIYPEFSW